MTMSCDDAGTIGVQRFEVFTGAGRRRNWPAEVKASIVAESFSGQETVCAVARRHALSPSQLFTWRRELRKQFEERGVALPTAPMFVPAVVEVAAVDDQPAAALRRPRKRRRSKASAVELEIDGVAVKIGRDAYSGVIYVFRAKRADRIKLVWWDGTGLCLMAKKLESGGFKWPGIQDGVMRLTSAQLGALLEGLDWRRVHAGRRPIAPQIAG